MDLKEEKKDEDKFSHLLKKGQELEKKGYNIASEWFYLKYVASYFLTLSKVKILDEKFEFPLFLEKELKMKFKLLEIERSNSSGVSSSLSPRVSFLLTIRTEFELQRFFPLIHQEILNLNTNGLEYFLSTEKCFQWKNRFSKKIILSSQTVKSGEIKEELDLFEVGTRFIQYVSYFIHPWLHSLSLNQFADIYQSKFQIFGDPKVKLFLWNQMFNYFQKLFRKS